MRAIRRKFSYSWTARACRCQECKTRFVYTYMKSLIATVPKCPKCKSENIYVILMFKSSTPLNGVVDHDFSFDRNLPKELQTELSKKAERRRLNNLNRLSFRDSKPEISLPVAYCGGS